MSEEEESVTHVLVDIDASALDAIDAVKAARAGVTSLPGEGPPSSVAPIPATVPAGPRPRLDSEPETMQPPKTLGVHGIGTRPSSAPPSSGVVLPRLSTPVEEMSTLRNAAVVREAKRQAMATDIDDELPPTLARGERAREALVSTDLATPPGGSDPDFDDATDVDHVETTALLHAPASALPDPSPAIAAPARSPALGVPEPSPAIAAPPPTPSLRRHNTVVAFPPPPPPKIPASLGPTRPPAETATDLFATDMLPLSEAPPLPRTSQLPLAPADATSADEAAANPPIAFPSAPPLRAPPDPPPPAPLLPPPTAPAPIAPRGRRPLLAVAIVVGLCSIVAVVGIGATMTPRPNAKPTTTAATTSAKGAAPDPTPSPSAAPLPPSTEAPVATTAAGTDVGAVPRPAPAAPNTPNAASSAEPSVAATPPHPAGSPWAPRAGPSARPGLRRPGRPPWRPPPRPTKKPTTPASEKTRP